MVRNRWAVLTLGVTVLGIGLLLSRASARGPLELSPTALPATLGTADDTVYEVYLASIEVHETKADGSAWDVGGGKPDLRIIMSNERSGKTFVSELAKDTYAVKFEPKVRVLDVVEGDILDNLVFDEDLLDHDLVGLSRKALTAGILGKKELDLSFGRVKQLRLEFQPKKP
jgi:hypothetical protein